MQWLRDCDAKKARLRLCRSDIVAYGNSDIVLRTVILRFAQLWNI